MQETVAWSLAVLSGCVAAWGLLQRSRLQRELAALEQRLAGADAARGAPEDFFDASLDAALDDAAPAEDSKSAEEGSEEGAAVPPGAAPVRIELAPLPREAPPQPDATPPRDTRSYEEALLELEVLQDEHRRLRSHFMSVARRKTALEEEIALLQQTHGQAMDRTLHLDRELERAQSTLSALDMVVEEASVDPLTPTRRESSLQALSDLHGEQEARAVTLSDGERHLEWGQPQFASRLLDWQARMGPTDEALDALLNGPWTLLSLRCPDRGVHFSRLPGGSLCLALEGRQAPPRLAMRHALLRLTGGVDPVAREPQSAPPSQESDGEPLLSWANRWNVRSACVFSPRRLPLSATPDRRPLLGGLQSLEGALEPAAGLDWSGPYTAIATRDDGRALTLRRPHLDGPGLAAVALSDHPLDGLALKELDAVLQWMELFADAAEE